MTHPIEIFQKIIRFGGATVPYLGNSFDFFYVCIQIQDTSYCDPL